MLLTAARLRKWTGIRQKAALKRWLRDNGVLAFEDAAGWPVTTRRNRLRYSRVFGGCLDASD